MNLRLLLLPLAAVSTMALMAQDATDEPSTDGQKSFTIGNYDDPGDTEILWGNGSFWERYPFQWYNTHCGGQFIYRSEYLTQLADDNGAIDEIVFKYGDDGSFVPIEAQATIFAEYVDQREFEKKGDSDDYQWIVFDPTAPACTMEYSVELYYGEDEEMHFVLSRPLEFEADKSLLITAWSTCTNGYEAQAMVGYATRTEGMTSMVFGDDNKDFLEVYDTGIEYPYMDPNPVMPILKVFYTPQPTSVKSVSVDDSDAQPEFFTLSGARVNRDNMAPGIYIRRAGNSAEKVVVK